MRPVSRIEPKLPVGSMQTFQILAPESTHFRPATCEESNCAHHLNGWHSPIDESTELGQQQAYYIRNNSGRRYTENRDLAPGITVFKFEPGQKCFQQHRMRLDRPEIFLVKDGDWRGNPTGRIRKHTRPEDWVDDFANHQQTLADEIEKG